jgi:hypothetical protein
MPKPRGVGWGDYVIAWLLTYQGSNCELWRHVYDKCMESELCREIIELLQSRGFNIRLHKCYDPSLDIEIVEADPAPRQSNLTSASKPTNTTPNNHTKTMQKLKTPKPSKQSSLKRPCRLDAYALSLFLKPLKPTSPLPHPPLINAFQRGSRVVGALVLSQAPPSGGPHRPTIGFSKRSRWIGLVGFP